MTPLARAWLRRISLGLPIAGLSVGAPLVLTLAACQCPGVTDEAHSFPITGDQAALLLDQDGRPIAAACRSLCTELARGTVVDGATTDGGLGTVPSNMLATPSTCEVVSVDAMLEARCHWSELPPCLAGRRPEGLEEVPLRAPTAGEWLARMAWMEAASVDAFEDLARELASFDAPRTLIESARAAAGDERRHAVAIGRLAITRGAVPTKPSRSAHPMRSLLAMAIDNAREGGVRETFGALLASHQASFARDVDVRMTMAAIARDEARHALLSDRIDAWVRPRVGSVALDQERSDAARALEATIATECDDESAAALGLPSLELQRNIIRALA